MQTQLNRKSYADMSHDERMNYLSQNSSELKSEMVRSAEQMDTICARATRANS